MNIPALDPDFYRMHAFELGLQYYGAGRFAVASGFTPVSGNLLHHAIEMFLKGVLAPNTGVAGLRAFSHNLEELWKKFRDTFPNSSLASFDSLIHELHSFERIRYPETLIKGGGLFAVGFPSGARHVQLSGTKVPEYNLSVEDIDSLVSELFKVGGVNANFFRSLQQEHAEKYFSYRNKTPLL